MLEFRCAAGDWAGALITSSRIWRAFAKDAYRRQRAILLTARALAAEETDRDAAKRFALEANKLAPALVPAAALAARLLAEAGQLRKAHRIIDKAWAAQSASRTGAGLMRPALRRLRRATGSNASRR